MVGENFDFFHVVECVDEFARPDEKFVVVTHAGDEYVADPDGLVDLVEIAEHVDDVLVVVTGEFFMLFGINVLDVDEQQVGALHESFELSEVGFITNKVYARGVDAGVYACGFRGFKEFNKKIHLCKRLAAAYGDAAVFAPVTLVAQGFLEQIFCRNFERTVADSVCTLCTEVPCFRVVAELATHGAALHEYDKTHSRAVY